MATSNNLLDQILIHGPSAGTVLLVLKHMQEQGRTSEIIQGCLKALDSHPDSTALKKLLAESYLEAGFVGLAESELNSVIRDINDLSDVFKMRARILVGQGRMDEAGEALNIYLSHNPTDADGLELLAQTTAEPTAAPLENSISEPAEEVPETTTETEQIEAASKFESWEKTIPDELWTGPMPGSESENEPERAYPLPDRHEPLEVEHDRPGESRQSERIIEDDAAKEIVDLATPTLAELYAGQGQILEAIGAYEKILLNNPDDKASEKRLAELKASIEKIRGPVDTERDYFRKIIEKNIQILENWKNRIHTLKNG